MRLVGRDRDERSASVARFDDLSDEEDALKMRRAQVRGVDSMNCGY